MKDTITRIKCDQCGVVLFNGIEVGDEYLSIDKSDDELFLRLAKSPDDKSSPQRDLISEIAGKDFCDKKCMIEYAMEKINKI